MIATDILRATFIAFRAERILSQSRENLPFMKRVTYSLRDTFFSLPHLVLRVRYLAIAIIGNCLWHRDFKSAGKNLEDLVTTVILDSLLTITGLVSLIVSPCTNKVNQFNSRANRYFLETSIFNQRAPELLYKII